MAFLIKAAWVALNVLEQVAPWEAGGILVHGWKTLICPSIKLDQ